MTAAVHGMTTATGKISQAANELLKRTEKGRQAWSRRRQRWTNCQDGSDGGEEGGRGEDCDDRKKDAEDSNGVVREAADAMGAISESSDQVSQIIGVIYEVAFQTNQPALNAGRGSAGGWDGTVGILEAEQLVPPGIMAAAA